MIEAHRPANVKAMGSAKKATGGAALDIKILRGRVYHLSQRQKWNGADEFEVSLELLGAGLAAALDSGVTHLVTADGTLNKTTQKKVDGLVKKGAAIEVVSSHELYEHVSLPPQLVGQLLQGGEEGQAQLFAVLDSYRYDHPTLEIEPKNLRGLNWSHRGFANFKLHDLDLRDAVLPGALLFDAERSVFDSAKLVSVSISGPSDCSFKDADLNNSSIRGECEGSTFEGANLQKCSLYTHVCSSRPDSPPVFRAVQFDGGKVSSIDWEGVDFSACSAVGSTWTEVDAPSIQLAGADLTGAKLTDVNFSKANLTNAVLRNARLIDVDLRKANLEGADFTGATLVGTKIDSKLKKESIKGLADALAGGPKMGAALTALEAAVTPAKSVVIELLLREESDDPGVPDLAKEHSSMKLDLSNASYGMRVYHLARRVGQAYLSDHTNTFSEGFRRCVMYFLHAEVCFETITVKVSKSPTPGPEIRELAIAALAEAFGKEPPPEAELKKLTKAYRAKVKALKEAELAQRKKETEAWEKEYAVRQEKEQQAERAARPQPAKKVKDLETFVAALDVRADAGRIKNAKKMLKGSGFELFHDISDPNRVLGVIKSQSDDSLVYGVKLDATGEFSCCTQNLRPCGGLRGALCKHHLVLLLGLVQAGVLKAATVDQWIEKSLDHAPELDKDEMGDVFLKFKGAEAGEIDWRPTETVPEDFYAY